MNLNQTLISYYIGTKKESEGVGIQEGLMAY